MSAKASVAGEAVYSRVRVVLTVFNLKTFSASCSAMEGVLLAAAGDPNESPLAVQRSEDSPSRYARVCSYEVKKKRQTTYIFAVWFFPPHLPPPPPPHPPYSANVTAQSSDTPIGAAVGDVASNGASEEKPTINSEPHDTAAATQDSTASDEETLKAEEPWLAGSGSRSELPVLEPLSPTMSRAGNLNEQYEFLRRTLSHSRHRFSTRRSRPPPLRNSRGEQQEHPGEDGRAHLDRGVGETRLSRGFAASVKGGREARTVSNMKEIVNPKRNPSKGVWTQPFKCVCVCVCACLCAMCLCIHVCVCNKCAHLCGYSHSHQMFTTSDVYLQLFLA